MIEVYERLGSHFAGALHTQLSLTHEQREKGRLRAFAPDGEEVRLFLERGEPLGVGEFLRGRCGKVVQVTGAVEPVMTALCSDWYMFSRACYHMGNRHVKLQLGNCWMRFAPDHVLAKMLRGIGLSVHEDNAVFTPESGAYRNGRHQH